MDNLIDDITRIYVELNSVNWRINNLPLTRRKLLRRDKTNLLNELREKSLKLNLEITKNIILNRALAEGEK